MHTPPYDLRIMRNFAKFVDHFLVLDIFKMSIFVFLKDKFTKSQFKA